MNLISSKLVILVLAFSTLAAGSLPAIAAEKDTDEQVSEMYARSALLKKAHESGMPPRLTGTTLTGSCIRVTQKTT